MFGAAGTMYVYRSYGMHWCANIVTGEVGDPQAVLLRGGLVVDGLKTVVDRRKRTTSLADGPGKLTQALAITDVFNGTIVNALNSVGLETGTAPNRIESTPRIGISKAVERPWRFVGT